MPVMNSLVVAAFKRDAPTIHCLPEDNAVFHDATSTADTGSGVPSTGPVVDEVACATADTSARAAERGWSLEVK